jgi:hypothetical protein
MPGKASSTQLARASGRRAAMVDSSRAHRDAAILAVLQARTRLENASRVVSERIADSATARRMAAILDILAPIVTALEELLSE